MRRFAVLDLETIERGTAPAPNEGEEKRFPAAPHWRIVCTGLGLLSVPESDKEVASATLGSVCSEAESETLARVVDRLNADQRDRRTLVTFNGRRFDMPVVMATCMRYAIAAPFWFARNTRTRYSTDGHIDLADELGEYGSAIPVSLDTWAEACGLGRKTDDGAKVHEMWALGERQRIADYCAEDVRLTMRLLTRWLRLRGEIPEDTEAVVQKVIDHVESRIEC